MQNYWPSDRNDCVSRIKRYRYYAQNAKESGHFESCAMWNRAVDQTFMFARSIGWNVQKIEELAS